MYEGVLVLKDGGKRPFVVQTIEEVTEILAQYAGKIARMTFRQIRGAEL